MTEFNPIYLTEEEHTALDHTGVPGVQSGASVAVALFVCGGPLDSSPACSLPLIGNDIQGVLPLAVRLAPGATLDFRVNGDDLGPWTLTDITVVLSNAAGTEMLVVEGGSGEPVVHGDSLDLGRVNDSAGSDLALAENSLGITSAVGGMFFGYAVIDVES